MADNRRLRRRRLSMMKEDPHCAWCGTEVFEYSQEYLSNRAFPDNMATIDHLNSRNLFPNGRPMTPGITTVLSCRRCNLDRAVEEQLGIRWVLPERCAPGVG